MNEVATFVRDNRHLPDIPSQAEVEEKGINLGEMQSRLLAKIEELTLHMIQEHNRNDRLEHENHDLKMAIREIQKAIHTSQE